MAVIKIGVTVKVVPIFFMGIEYINTVYEKLFKI